MSDPGLEIAHYLESRGAILAGFFLVPMVADWNHVSGKSKFHGWCFSLILICVRPSVVALPCILLPPVIALTHSANALGLCLSL